MRFLPHVTYRDLPVPAPLGETPKDVSPWRRLARLVHMMIGDRRLDE
jgi:hypothetical protein